MDFLWQLGEGEGVGGGEFALPLGGGEDVPALGGDPVDAGHVGCGDEAFDFEEFGVAGGAGGIHHEGVVDDSAAVRRILRRARLVEVDEGEHLAANGFIADPEDEVRAPLHGLGHVGEGEEIGAEAFDVHGLQGTRRQVPGTRRLFRGDGRVELAS